MCVPPDYCRREGGIPASPLALEGIGAARRWKRRQWLLLRRRHQKRTPSPGIPVAQSDWRGKDRPDIRQIFSLIIGAVSNEAVFCAGAKVAGVLVGRQDQSLQANIRRLSKPSTDLHAQFTVSPTYTRALIIAKDGRDLDDLVCMPKTVPVLRGRGHRWGIGL